MEVATSMPPGWSVDELARLANLPVRTIREYQTLRILDPPLRQGRRGIYSEPHLNRLRLIGRLQDRGYSLAGIRDLFEAWTAGRDLAGVIDDPDARLLEELPATVDRSSMASTLRHVPEQRLADLIALGILIEDGPDRYCVPSPSLLHLLADATENGLSVDDALGILEAIATGVRGIADSVATRLQSALKDRAGDQSTRQLLLRGRGLIAQGTSRFMLHELGRELLDPVVEETNPEVTGLIQSLRVGAVGSLSDPGPTPEADR
jgi:DNA-binding transcriptional MerR regulator